jgi:hypothetical protein
VTMPFKRWHSKRQTLQDFPSAYVNSFPISMYFHFTGGG